MHHGMIAQDTYFDDVLRDITNFLNANPSETVLFRLRAEHTSENNTRSYAATLDSYLAQNGSKHWVPTNSNPTLDEIRGKFVILQEFSGGNYGLSYGYIDKQDDYQMSTNWDLYDKWTSIKNHINKAQNGNRNTIYMNYLSAAVGSMPYFVASGHSSNGTSAPRLATGLTTPGWNSSYPDFPRVSCFIGICTIAFEGTNILTADYIANGGFTGMVMADFPGKRLIENIIKLNDLKPQHLEQEYRELKDGRTGLCLDVSGGSSANGTNVALWTCHGGQNQKWAYDASTGFMRSALGKCLDNRGQAYNGGEIVIWDCVNSNNLKFDWLGTSLRNRHNNNIAVDAYGTGAGSQVGQWSYHGGANQQWHWGN
jgi:1-phosphatidylinositol phosphodiesterase